MPELSDLPTEIRQHIYSFVLPQKRYWLDSYDVRATSTTAASRGVVCRGHTRRRKHRGEKWDNETRQWNTVNRELAIVTVSKQVNADTMPLLYGQNEFVFAHAGGLERFLHQIGNNKQYLHCIAIEEYCLKYAGRYQILNQVIQTLAAEAKDLRSFTIGHHSLCTFETSGESRVQAVFERFRPLLESLKGSYEARNLAACVLDVIKIVLSPCMEGQSYDSEARADASLKRVHRHFIARSLRRCCRCICTRVATNHKRMEEELKGLIAAQINIS